MTLFPVLNSASQIQIYNIFMKMLNVKINVGFRLDENLTWKYQIEHIRSKLGKANFILAYM